MTDVWQNLKTESNPILLYGTGNGADKILAELKKHEIKISGVFASDGFVRERYFQGFKVMSLSEAEETFSNFTVLFAFGSNRQEVISNIKYIASRHKLLAPEVPVCGGEIFNAGFARQNADKLFEVYNLLADELSRKVFKETVLFKLDGNIEHLFACETDSDEAFSSILKLSSGSSFLDLGAYNGDTVLDFINRVGEFSHITAVEPDKKSFLKLTRNTDRYPITRINAAVSDSCGSVPFCFKSSRGSVFGGDELIPSVTIDSLCRDRHFDYIKFDVEGKELDAILGGEKTIKKDKPKMLISAYHKSEDYFTIPLLIHKIRSDYKIYMRHYPYIPAWDTSFYFV
ncbi:MAG: FkbM family methyltransferase [Clostridia bacterium]|nr:FkbM family methyltransferase [Clostridia bacterium]